MNNFPQYVSAGLAAIVTIGIIVLIALQLAVPVELWGAFSLVIGFFFGHQAGTGAANFRVK